MNRECGLKRRKQWQDAGALYEGGSMQPMVISQKAAELTKERVYQLLEYLE